MDIQLKIRTQYISRYKQWGPQVLADWTWRQGWGRYSAGTLARVIADLQPPPQPKEPPRRYAITAPQVMWSEDGTDFKEHGRTKEFLILQDECPRYKVNTRLVDGPVYGPSTVRIEVRLVHFSKIRHTEQFVVEVALNGKPWIWEVFKSTPDDETSASGLTIGDRDRIEFELPPGNHNIAVSLLASNCDQFLTRIRNPETDTDEEDDEQ